ncbi:hypothetical protein OG594_36415 [Streptomyces sp. NBC_01214]|uniref:hypothetical protein n=1 Tax=Streptomyces sp. NBC_01214 TaxID=2903777 RepID=UPI00225380D8|nr:hypothetical protein [Streptomyces sp. NBC_01214]MCX4804772.1 hypothetical protein [Streptomyces sp. NBC_01214]MCX4807044.1 hypothetical protein [Streptomyces sp. NBC_01214]
MRRLVIWYRGERTVTADELLALLPAGARLIHQQMPNIFLVESDEAGARHALRSADGWSVAPEQFGQSVQVGTGRDPR